MARYIDADAIQYVTQLESVGNGQYKDVDFVYKASIDAIPTADVIPIVRCKDCVFCDKYVAPGKGVAFICSQWFGEEVEENHFCSYGRWAVLDNET